MWSACLSIYCSLLLSSSFKSLLRRAYCKYLLIASSTAYLSYIASFTVNSTSSTINSAYSFLEECYKFKAEVSYSLNCSFVSPSRRIRLPRFAFIVSNCLIWIYNSPISVACFPFLALSFSYFSFRASTSSWVFFVFKSSSLILSSFECNSSFNSSIYFVHL